MAILGSIGAAVYAHRLAGLMPAGIDAETAHTATQTLGGATFVAGALLGAPGVELLRLARESFVVGLHAAAGTGALVLLAAAVATAVFRHRFGPLHPTEGGEATVVGATTTAGERVAA